MKIEATELEYNDADKVVLDYWLGGDGETKEQWAKRVWDKCNEWQETDGKGYDGKGLERVFARCPYELWEGKKRNRRLRLYEELDIKNKVTIKKEKLLDSKVIEEELLTRRRPQYPAEISDPAIIGFKDLPSYRTRKSEHEDRIKKVKELREVSIGLKKKKLAICKKQGMSDSDIAIMHPELGGLLGKKISLRTPKGKK